MATNGAARIRNPICDIFFQCRIETEHALYNASILSTKEQASKSAIRGFTGSTLDRTGGIFWSKTRGDKSGSICSVGFRNLEPRKKCLPVAKKVNKKLKGSRRPCVHLRHFVGGIFNFRSSAADKNFTNTFVLWFACVCQTDKGDFVRRENPS